MVYPNNPEGKILNLLWGKSPEFSMPLHINKLLHTLICALFAVTYLSASINSYGLVESAAADFRFAPERIKILLAFTGAYQNFTGF